jgi:hypothetical protein
LAETSLPWWFRIAGPLAHQQEEAILALTGVGTVGGGAPKDDHDGDRDRGPERPARDNIREPMHGEHKSAEPNEPGEQDPTPMNVS